VTRYDSILPHSSNTIASGISAVPRGPSSLWLLYNDVVQVICKVAYPYILGFRSTLLISGLYSSFKARRGNNTGFLQQTNGFLQLRGTNSTASSE
jgi:hypothetical protein